MGSGSLNSTPGKKGILTLKPKPPKTVSTGVIKPVKGVEIVDIEIKLPDVAFVSSTNDVVKIPKNHLARYPDSLLATFLLDGFSGDACVPTSMPTVVLETVKYFYAVGAWPSPHLTVNRLCYVVPGICRNLQGLSNYLLLDNVEEGGLAAAVVVAHDEDDSDDDYKDPDDVHIGRRARRRERHTMYAYVPPGGTGYQSEGEDTD
jgi:hypothetical protein